MKMGVVLSVCVRVCVRVSVYRYAHAKHLYAITPETLPSVRGCTADMSSYFSRTRVMAVPRQRCATPCSPLHALLSTKDPVHTQPPHPLTPLLHCLRTQRQLASLAVHATSCSALYKIASW